MVKLYLPYFLATVLGPVDALNSKKPFHLASVAESDATQRVKGSESGPRMGKSPPLGQKKGSKKGRTATGSSDFSLVFGMSNEADANELLVYSRDTDDGTLAFQNAVPTGGLGGFLNTVTGNSASSPLGSQDSILVYGSCVFAVNAGSESVSSFRISEGSVYVNLEGVYPTGGDRPTSITVKDDLVYVMNSGGQGSFQGFRLNDDCSMTSIGDTIELEQGSPVLEDVPFGPTSPGEIGFTPEGDILVLIKLNGGQQGFPTGLGSFGSLNHYVISDDGTTSADSLTQTLIDDRPGWTNPFSFDWNGEGLLAVVEIDPLATTMGGPGGVSYWEEDDGVYTQVGDIVMTEEICACWIKYNNKNGCSYVTNACNFSTGNSISSISADGVPTPVVAETLRPLDFAISDDGNYLYVYAPAYDSDLALGEAHIVVYETADDACTLTEVQVASDGFAAGILVGNGPAGIAAYPAQ